MAEVLLFFQHHQRPYFFPILFRQALILVLIIDFVIIKLPQLAAYLEQQ